MSDFTNIIGSFRIGYWEEEEEEQEEEEEEKEEEEEIADQSRNVS